VFITMVILKFSRLLANGFATIHHNWQDLAHFHRWILLLKQFQINIVTPFSVPVRIGMQEIVLIIQISRHAGLIGGDFFSLESFNKFGDELLFYVSFHIRKQH